NPGHHTAVARSGQFFEVPHRHCKLMGHAPDRMQDGLTGEYRDMIHADAAAGIEKRRKAFLRKWRLKRRAVADSLEEAGDRLFTSARLDPSQWKPAGTTDATERLRNSAAASGPRNVLPCAQTVPMLPRALMASGQIQMRQVDGRETPAQPMVAISLDLAA
ncbi:MAG: hypothetical protein Q4P24_14405, partial [Rhodobacterales bacterium]|nr:hypothetical protein [Rhodobacterales bacterium]